MRYIRRISKAPKAIRKTYPESLKRNRLRRNEIQA